VFITYPFLRIKIKILYLAMLEETGQSNAIICEMWLFSNNDDVVFSSFGVKLHEFLALYTVRKNYIEVVCLRGVSHERYTDHSQTNDYKSFSLTAF
jgi:hypothetical protein